MNTLHPVWAIWQDENPEAFDDLVRLAGQLDFTTAEAAAAADHAGGVVQTPGSILVADAPPKRRRRRGWGTRKAPPIWLAPALPPVVVSNPSHPLASAPVYPPPTGYFVGLSRPVAEQIAAWWVGRPATEWSARACVKAKFYGRGDSAQPWMGYIYDIFRADDSVADAHGHQHRDSGGGANMLAEWEGGLVDTLAVAGRLDDIRNLRCHIHSHNDMGAFWSGTDVRMLGACLDEQAAVQSRAAGWHLALVFGRDPSVRCRLDGWARTGTRIDYWTIDQIPVKVKWAGLSVDLAEVLDIRRKTPAPTFTNFGGFWNDE
jgi:hypothetical protein